MGNVRPDDDVLPNLPPLDGDAGDLPASIDSTDTERDSADPDAGVGGDGADESVGLDTTAAEGLHDDAELFGLNDGEGESWLRDDEPAIDAGLDEDDLEADGAEEGWAAFADTPDDIDEDDNEIEDDGASSFVDRGEEGVDDEQAVSGEDDEADLPPMNLNAETGNEAADDLDVREAEELETTELSFEDERRWMGASLASEWPKDRIAISYLGAEDAMMPVVPGQEITSFAIDARDPNRIAVGTRLGGAFVSFDAGASFEHANSWSRSEAPKTSVAFHVAIEQRIDGARLWGRTARGALYRSDDFGGSWHGPVLLQPVMALAVDPRGGVVIMSTPLRGTAQLGRYTDAGWVMRNAPAPPRLRDDGFVDVAVHGAHIAIAYDGDPAGIHVSDDGGETFTSLRSLPSPTCVALAEEHDGVSLYASLFFAGADRGVVIRRAADGTELLVFDVGAASARFEADAAEEGEGNHRIHALRASATPEATTLHISTGVGIFRVVLR
ncbi:MAG: hypothetical protein IPK60_02715 [Sandaracinaceae bacterium]|nr:hypothetical protein [Sandaracinaceae bacterium]